MTDRRTDAKPNAAEDKRPETDQKGSLPPGSSLDQKQQDNAKKTDEAQPGTGTTRPT